MERDEIVRITLYLFKKFAREHYFWEEYKKLSVQLMANRKFINVVREYEPVELIQSSNVFCVWPSYSFNKKRIESWPLLSTLWARICLENKLFYDEEKALKYVNHNIHRLLETAYRKGELNKIKIK